MDIKRLNPWNCLKDEDYRGNVPVVQQHAQHPLVQLQRDIDRMFDGVFRGFGFPSLDSERTLSNEVTTLQPRIDIASTDKEYSITAEVPGVDEKDVQLELADNGTLTIRGEKKQEKEEKQKDFYRVERSYGSFQRLLSLPEDADRENIQASFKNGVLTVSVARRQAKKITPKLIDIKKAA